jgi:hypothetical protein
MAKIKNPRWIIIMPCSVHQVMRGAFESAGVNMSDVAWTTSFSDRLA